MVQETLRPDRRQTNLVLRETLTKPKETPKINFHGLDTTTRVTFNLNRFREPVRKIAKLSTELRKLWGSCENLDPLSDLCLINLTVRLLESPSGKLERNKLFQQLTTCVEKVLHSDREAFWKRRKMDFKNLLVIKKCIEFRKKVLGSSMCKICEEETPLEGLADHSFKCFARKSLHQELDRINRKIINKIAAAVKKTHTALRRNL